MKKSATAFSMIAPIELATEDLLNDTECVVTSSQKQSNDDLSLIYWNVVNISKQTYEKSDWYLEDTICHSQIWYLLHNVSLRSLKFNRTEQMTSVYKF